MNVDRRPALAALVLVVMTCACGAPAARREDPPRPDDDAITFEPIDGDAFEVVSARPARVGVPSSYDPAVPMPFMLFLHGYGVSGDEMAGYLAFESFAEEHGFIHAAPTGMIDASGKPFWNADTTCCDFEQTGVDDSAYLRAIVDEARQVANIDAARVYVLGHSNGGFMAQRLACDHADLFSAIVSVAGATTLSDACAPSEGVAVLQVHGTDDETIAYDGGALAPGLVYPGAVETAAAWAARNACDAEPEASGNVDIETLAGEETSIEKFVGCKEHGAVELWTVAGGTHVPRANADYLSQLYGFMEAHAR